MTTTATKPKIRTCRKCGRRHQTLRKLATCEHNPTWCCGNGPWASFSDCPRGRTIELHDSEAEALAAKKRIDETACGGMCRRMHYVRRID